MMMRMTPGPMYFMTETGWAKIIIEFGAVGAIAFFGFLYGCIFGTRHPVALKGNLAGMTLTSGILDGPPHGMIFSCLLWARPSDDVLPAPKPEQEAPPRASIRGEAQVRVPAPALGRGTSG
jgi:hypothetical protein